MNHPDIQQAINSIKIVHELIYQVFTAQREDSEDSEDSEDCEDCGDSEDSETALHILLTHFTDDFSMIGINGMIADRDTVAAVFTRMQGQKQGAPIETSDYECICRAENLLAMRYLETQHFSGVTTVRRSLVILTRTDGGIWQWHYLHETPLAS